MAPKSTPSSSTKPTRAPRKRKAAVQSEAASEAVVTSGDDDFGAGLDEVAVSKTAAPKRRRPVRKKKADEAASAADDDFGADLDIPAKPAARKSAPAAEAPAQAVESFREEAPREVSVERNDERNESGDTGGSGSGESSGRPGGRPHDGQEREEGGRRRRRRKRGGRSNDQQSGEPRQSQAQQHQPRGGQNNRNQEGGRRNKGRGRDRDRNRGGNGGPQGGPQGRRLTKFEQNSAPSAPAITSGTVEGVLELHPKGYGFLRSAANDYGALEIDPFISSTFVEKHKLREGVMIRGEVGPGTRGQGPRVLEIESIDGRPPEEFEKIQHFDNLTAINPYEQIKLETGPTPITMRVMDLLTPLGKGQRALIVAPPRSGKTMLLQDIAEAVSINHPEIHLIVLLIDERPEEVTEMRRSVKGEVIASSMDRDVESHVRISQLVIERGKRIAESGKHCLILMDSVTRCARAFNKWIGGGRESKIGTGGLDVRALEIPRKMFGTARLFDEGGSLTVCATALIDTGSRMDDAIFQEFKGTGNMELVLSRDLAERRIWPAIDIQRSGTRREEKILDADLLEEITMLRRSLVSLSPVEAMETLTRTMAKFPSNREFLKKIRSVL